MTTISEFRFSVADEDISDLHGRLKNTRWPDQLPGQAWIYGTDMAELQALTKYWLNDFDWKSAENSINAWPQFLTTIDGEQIHFIHARSPRSDARPLILSHGWPGSIVEFLHLIRPLIEPEDPSLPAFHVVAPSLPGFTLSGPTITPGVSPRRIAKMWISLMAQLGYDQYLAQGGDWGAIITSWIGQLDPTHCAGIHINMLTVTPTDELMVDMSEDETQMLGAAMAFQTSETGYQAIQGTKPQTLAYALNDSPVGLLSWILEKFRTWSDCDGDVFGVHDRDRLLANVALYWFTGTAGSAARIYYEFSVADERAVADSVAVPTAGAMFPLEIYRCSRRWAESSYNIVQWTEFDRGGHFAALEQPVALLEDIRRFAGTIDDTGSRTIDSGAR